jgi:hypothetical protein
MLYSASCLLLDTAIRTLPTWHSHLVSVILCGLNPNSSASISSLCAAVVASVWLLLLPLERPALIRDIKLCTQFADIIHDDIRRHMRHCVDGVYSMTSENRDKSRLAARMYFNKQSLCTEVCLVYT